MGEKKLIERGKLGDKMSNVMKISAWGITCDVQKCVYVHVQNNSIHFE